MVYVYVLYMLVSIDQSGESAKWDYTTRHILEDSCVWLLYYSSDTCDITHHTFFKSHEHSNEHL